MMLLFLVFFGSFCCYSTLLCLFNSLLQVLDNYFKLVLCRRLPNKAALPMAAPAPSHSCPRLRLSLPAVVLVRERRSGILIGAGTFSHLGRLNCLVASQCVLGTCTGNGDALQKCRGKQWLQQRRQGTSAKVCCCWEALVWRRCSAFWKKEAASEARLLERGGALGN